MVQGKPREGIERVPFFGVKNQNSTPHGNGFVKFQRIHRSSGKVGEEDRWPGFFRAVFGSETQLAPTHSHFTEKTLRRKRRKKWSIMGGKKAQGGRLGMTATKIWHEHVPLMGGGAGSSGGPEEWGRSAKKGGHATIRASALR